MYIDGTVTKNPGPAASAAVFYGRKLDIRTGAEKGLNDLNFSTTSSEDISDVEQEVQNEEESKNIGDNKWE